MVKPRSAKAKGTKLEKWVESELKRIGFSARRQPGSGIYRDFPHDNQFELPGYGSMIVECKAWKNGWRTGDKAMGSAELLVIKRNHHEPCVYMPWSTFKTLCEQIHMIDGESDTTEAQADPDIPEALRSKIHAKNKKGC